MRRDARIAVVGGSLVGLATYHLLRQAGFKYVSVLEGTRVVHPTSGGVMGLRHDTVAQLARAGIETGQLAALSSNLVRSFDVADGTAHFRGESAFPGITASWDTLHAALRRDVPVEHGRRVRDVRVSAQHGTAGVILGPDDLPRWFDLVIFADGRTSTGRRLMDPDRADQYAYQGYVTWRGVSTPYHRPVTGFHRYYDPPHGTLFSLTEPVLQTGRAYWEFSHNMPRADLDALTEGTRGQRGFLLPREVGEDARALLRLTMVRRGLHPDFQEIVDRGDQVMLIPVYDLPLPERAQWDAGAHAKVALVGDALIPARLQVGAGLNMGIKQAASLVRYLAADQDLAGWERTVIDEIAPWIELGRSRAHRSNLGTYQPVFPGRTAIPDGDAWATPRWVIA